MLDDHFAYKPNTAFERHLFRKMSQREEETVTQFVHRPREQAALCAFGGDGVAAPERSGCRASQG